MRLMDIISETYTSIVSNPARSSLTILGIVIGIASVITMVAIGQGASQSVQNSINALGSNLVAVTPGSSQSGVIRGAFGSAQTLSLADVTAIKQEVAKTATAVAPEMSGRYQAVVARQNTNASVIGTEPSYPTVHNISIALGGFFSDRQVQTDTPVAVLGPNVRDSLFGTDATDVLGKKIRINNVEFTVIGVTVSKGSSGPASSADTAIYIPMTTYQRDLSNQQYVSDIAIQASDKSNVPLVEQQVTNLLLSRHGISDPSLADFTVVNESDIASTLNNVTQIFTVMLASIAGISLLVGGIGIMNMMLTTVTERTREIGLRKAIGAKPNNITLQFLAEAISLTFLGGVVGVLLGWGVAQILRSTGITQPVVTLSSVLLAFGVSAAVGIIFGYYPARRAAGLHPIDALRYE